MSQQERKDKIHIMSHQTIELVVGHGIEVVVNEGDGIPMA